MGGRSENRPVNGSNEAPSEQIKDASWSDDSRGKRSRFYIANCGQRPRLNGYLKNSTSNDVAKKGVAKKSTATPLNFDDLSQS